MIILQALALGFAFGWLLQKGRLSRYATIVGVYRFTDLTVLKFLLSALVVGALATRALDALGFAAPLPIPPTYLAGNLVGGLLFGVGMAISGFCPGTIVAGAAEGSLDYLIPGGLGLLTGALAYGALYPSFFPALSRLANLGPIAFAGALGVDPWLLVLILAELAGLLFYALERRRPRQALP